MSEYWIVGPDNQAITLLRLDSNGKYREVRPRKGCLHSQAIAGFWVDTNWFWQDPLPATFDLLAAMLGSRPS